MPGPLQFAPKVKGKIMDLIEIKGIKLNAIVGIKSWEQQMPQAIVLDLAFPVDASLVSQTDDLNQTIDYEGLTNFCEKFIAGNKVGLIETLAEKLSAALLENFNFPKIKLCLHKPNALSLAQDITITIERNRNAS